MAPTFPSGIRLFETYTSFLGSYVQTGVVPLSVFNGTHDKFDGKSVVVVNVNIDASAKNYQAFNFATNSNTHAVFPLVIPSVPEKQIEPPHAHPDPSLRCAHMPFFLVLSQGSLLLKELIFDFYLPSLQLVLCRVAAVERLPVHQP